MNLAVAQLKPTSSKGLANWLRVAVVAFVAVLVSTASIQAAEAATGGSSPVTSGGYWLAASDGGVFAYVGAPFYGSLARDHLAQPIVGIASTPGGGYWLAAADGGVFAFGDAQFYGSLPSLGVVPNEPITAIAPTSDGKGYLLLGADGGVFAFGDARFDNGLSLTPVDASQATPPFVGFTVCGYTVSSAVTAAGQVLAATRIPIEDPRSLSPAGIPVALVPDAHPMVGMAATCDPSRLGTWAVAQDGGVFVTGAVNNAPIFYGSAARLPLKKPVVGMTPAADGGGYWLAAADGGVFSFGDAAFGGSAANLHLAAPVVGIAAES